MKVKCIIILIGLSLINCAISSSLNSISNISSSISTSLGSISTSLESISTSIRSSSESISDSKKEHNKEQLAYKAEIRYLTIFAINEGISSEDYIREMGRIARKFGLYHWKTNPYTYMGIGEGLKQSNVNPYQFKEILNSVHHEKLKEYLIMGYQHQTLNL